MPRPSFGQLARTCLTLCLFVTLCSSIALPHVEYPATNLTNPTSLPPHNGLELYKIVHGVGHQIYAYLDSPEPIHVGAEALLLGCDGISDLSLYTRSGIVILVQMRICEVVGRHFFAGPTPIFELCNLGLCKHFSGEVIATVPALPDSNPGPLGTGAVPQLALTNNGSSTGIQRVDRTNTYGGLPPQTRPANTSTTEVEYGAIYGFYMNASQTEAMFGKRFGLGPSFIG